MAHWLAQTYGIELDEMKHKNPDHLSAQAYELIKQLLKDYVDKPLSTTEQVMFSTILK